MANKIIKGLTIQIGADTLGLDKALKDVEAKGKTASSELREINSAIKIAGDSTALWEQKQKILNDAISRSKEKLKILEDAQKGFTERFRSGEIDKGTYDKFREKLTKSKDILAALKSQQEKMEAKFKSGEIDQGKYDKFCKAVENAEERVKKLETAEHSMEENLRIGNISEEQYRAFQREMEYARAAVEKYETGLEEANTKVKELGSESSDTADDVKELGDKADSTASGGISAMTVAIGNLVADGIKKAGSEIKDFTKDVIQTGASFEAVMSNVGAISGASSGDIEKLTKKAEKMGASTKFTAKEVADAFQYMAMAGWKTEDMLSGIDGIINLAAASGEDLATTSDIVTDALTAFGLTSADSGHFADVLAAASSNANTNVSMLGETFKYVAPVAGALNISVEDIAVAIGLLANSGIKSSQAGTTLRTILTRLSTDAGASSKSLGALGVLTEELGVDFYDTEGKVRDFGTILAEARQQWQTLSAEDSAAFAKKIAGEEGISGWLALMNSAPADIEKLSGAIRDCDGAATDMSTTMIDNLQGDMTILDSAVDGMKISLSKKLNPALRDITQYITSKMPEIEKSLEKVGGKAIKFLDFSIKNLPKAIDLLKKSMPFIKGVGAGFVGWKVTEKIGGGVDTVKKLRDALKGTSDNAGLASGSIAGVATALAFGAVSFVAAYEKAKREKEEKLFQELTEESDNLAKSIDDNIEEMKKLTEETDNAAEKDRIATQRVQDLWKELQKLVDENGKVKSGYEDRVKYIQNELTDATGVEIELVDGQIQKYGELKQTIDETIKKQHAQRLASIQGQKAEEASAQMKDAPDELIKAKENIENSLNEFKYLFPELRANSVEDLVEAVNRISGTNYTTDQAMESDDFLYKMIAKSVEISGDRSALEKLTKNITKYQAMAHNLRTDSQSYNNLIDEFSKNQYIVDSYDKAQVALASGNYDEAIKLFDKMSDANRAALADNKASTDKRLKELETAVDKAVKRYNASVELGAKDAEKTFSDSISSIIEDALNGGMTAGELLKSGIVEALSKIDGFDTTKLEAFIKGEVESLSDEMSKGFVSKTLSRAEDFIKNSMNGTSGGISALQQIMKSTASIYGSQPLSVYGPQPLKMYAQGGFCTDRGIVAEAGPELIEIINGGVKITPLTSSARNTVVNPTDQKPNVYYNNYTINATVGNRYDVTRIAEQLAAEQRRIEGGKGR